MSDGIYRASVLLADGPVTEGNPPPASLIFSSAPASPPFTHSEGNTPSLTSQLILLQLLTPLL